MEEDENGNGVDDVWKQNEEKGGRRWKRTERRMLGLRDSAMTNFQDLSVEVIRCIKREKRVDKV